MLVVNVQKVTYVSSAHIPNVDRKWIIAGQNGPK